jgi:hypothetical protein
MRYQSPLWFGVFFGVWAYLITLALGMFELPLLPPGSFNLIARIRRHAREHAERQRLKQAARALHEATPRWDTAHPKPAPPRGRPDEGVTDPPT